jgi:hypothetical protein
MRGFVLSAVTVAVVGALAALVGFASGEGTATARAKGMAAFTPLQQRLLSGTAQRELEAGTQLVPGARTRQTVRGQEQADLSGCPVDRGTNRRVNRDCLNLTDPDLQGRGQAQNETAIAHDPANPRRMVASANDYRRGDGNCYAYVSRDGGRSWEDSTVPMSFTRGTAFGGKPRQYWQAGGDTSVDWDTQGNAYLSCQVFNRGSAVSQNPDASSAFYVFRSTGSGGASWNFPGRPVAEYNDPTGQSGALLDKQYMTVDSDPSSPYRDRIYVTWTFFAADGTAYIYGAYSRDHGESFSSPKLVSTTSPLCSNPVGAPTPQGACNVNQFSQPVTGPDGALYVVWANYNVTGLRPSEDDEGGGAARRGAQAAAVDNRAQVLLAKSLDGGNTFSAPVKVADFYDLPDCATYQGRNPGRACVPEKGETQSSYFRAANYPSAAVDPRNAREIDVTFGSYINRHSNERRPSPCVPAGYDPDTFQALYVGVKVRGACNDDIVVSRSTDGGRTFSGGSTDVRALPSVREDDPQADQFFQWAATDARGRLAVSYYDRAYGSDEMTGFSDVSLSGSRNRRDFATVRVTSSSMPPATQFEGAFFGDYSGLSVAQDAHPAWMDTRDPNLFVCRDSAGQVVQPPRVCTAGAPNAALANDQNVYTRSLPVPTP